MEETKSEFLKAIRELEELDKEDEQEYLNACQDFAAFIKENSCKQTGVEND